MELCDELELQTWGNLDRSMSAAARLQHWQDTAYSRLRLFFVRIDGRMAARSWVRFELQENLGSRSCTSTSWVPSAAGGSAGRCWSTLRPWLPQTAGQYCRRLRST